jgi:hypothetical protein
MWIRKEPVCYNSPPFNETHGCSCLAATVRWRLKPRAPFFSSWFSARFALVRRTDTGTRRLWGNGVGGHWSAAGCDDAVLVER